MDLTANIGESGDTPSMLSGDAKVVVNGKMASFGQRMLAQVSDQVLEQFANNFRKKLAQIEQSSGASGSDPDEQGGAGKATNAPESSAAPASNEINGFAFILGTIKGLIAGLFKRK